MLYYASLSALSVAAAYHTLGVTLALMGRFREGAKVLRELSPPLAEKLRSLMRQ